MVDSQLGRRKLRLRLPPASAREFVEIMDGYLLEANFL